MVVPLKSATVAVIDTGTTGLSISDSLYQVHPHPTPNPHPPACLCRIPCIKCVYIDNGHRSTRSPTPTPTHPRTGLSISDSLYQNPDELPITGAAIRWVRGWVRGWAGGWLGGWVGWWVRACACEHVCDIHSHSNTYARSNARTRMHTHTRARSRARTHTGTLASPS